MRLSRCVSCRRMRMSRASSTMAAPMGWLRSLTKVKHDLVLNSLNAATRRALEAMMKGYEYQSDFAKKYVAGPHGAGRARSLRTS